jgi:hypothetical protein
MTDIWEWLKKKLDLDEEVRGEIVAAFGKNRNVCP